MLMNAGRRVMRLDITMNIKRPGIVTNGGSLFFVQKQNCAGEKPRQNQIVIRFMICLPF